MFERTTRLKDCIHRSRVMTNKKGPGDWRSPRRSVFAEAAGSPPGLGLRQSSGALAYFNGSVGIASGYNGSGLWAVSLRHDTELRFRTFLVVFPTCAYKGAKRTLAR